MDEVTDITETIKDAARKSKVRKAFAYAVAALVGAAALAVVAKKSTSSDQPEQV